MIKLKNRFRTMAISLFAGISTALASVQTALADTGFGGITVTPGGNGEITINPGDNVSIGGMDYKTGLFSMVAKYKTVAQVILAICVVTAIVCLILSITKLSASGISSNPMERKRAMTSLLISGVALALFGGLSIVVGFFWRFL